MEVKKGFTRNGSGGALKGFGLVSKGGPQFLDVLHDPHAHKSEHRFQQVALGDRPRMALRAAGLVEGKLF